jgi:hypothetical protein
MGNSRNAALYNLYLSLSTLKILVLTELNMGATKLIISLYVKNVFENTSNKQKRNL